tara:strand:- start:1244 stop:1423 length:180 start_codon:yes stop_codon:yes gene_type:complete
MEAAMPVNYYVNTDQGAVSRVNTLGNDPGFENKPRTEVGAVAGVVQSEGPQTAVYNVHG